MGEKREQQIEHMSLVEQACFFGGKVLMLQHKELNPRCGSNCILKMYLNQIDGVE